MYFNLQHLALFLLKSVSHKKSRHGGSLLIAPTQPPAKCRESTHFSGAGGLGLCYVCYAFSRVIWNAKWWSFIMRRLINGIFCGKMFHPLANLREGHSKHKPPPPGVLLIIAVDSDCHCSYQKNSFYCWSLLLVIPQRLLITTVGFLDLHQDTPLPLLRTPRPLAMSLA